MTTIHPHWDATDGAQPQPRVQKRAGSTRVPVAVPQGSRRPAAILGILGVIAIAFGVIQNLGEYSAQVAPVPVIVRLSAAGSSPKNFSIQQGQPITWKNTDTVTRTISSDLLTESGSMMGLAIKSGSSVTIVISPMAAPGSYSYTDDDADNAILGKITITQKVAASAPSISGSGTTAASTSSVASAASLAPVASTASEASVASTALTVSSSSKSSSSAGSGSVALSASSASRAVILSTGDDTFALPTHNAAGSHSSEDEVIAGIAKNPHVVGTATSRPQQQMQQGSSTAPIYSVPANEQLYGGAPLLAQQQYAHTTTTVAKTGAEAWALTLVSVVLLFWFCRKSLKAE